MRFVDNRPPVHTYSSALAGSVEDCNLFKMYYLIMFVKLHTKYLIIAWWLQGPKNRYKGLQGNIKQFPHEAVSLLEHHIKGMLITTSCLRGRDRAHRRRAVPTVGRCSHTSGRGRRCSSLAPQRGREGRAHMHPLQRLRQCGGGGGGCSTLLLKNIADRAGAVCLSKESGEDLTPLLFLVMRRTGGPTSAAGGGT